MQARSSYAVRMQGVLRLAAVVGIKEVLQLAGLEDEHLQDLERFASENKRHHKFHAWTFGRKSSTVRSRWASATRPPPAQTLPSVANVHHTRDRRDHMRPLRSRQSAPKCCAQVRDSSDTNSEDGSFSAVSMQSSHFRSPSRDDSMDLGERHADSLRTRACTGRHARLSIRMLA